MPPMPPIPPMPPMPPAASQLTICTGNCRHRAAVTESGEGIGCSSGGTRSSCRGCTQPRVRDSLSSICKKKLPAAQGLGAAATFGESPGEAGGTGVVLEGSAAQKIRVSQTDIQLCTCHQDCLHRKWLRPSLVAALSRTSCAMR